MENERIEALAAVLDGVQKVLILPHNDPDPDAIAASLALKHLLDQIFDVKAQIAYRGIIGRAENKALVRYLGNPLTRLTSDKPKTALPVALIDTQPNAGNNPLPPGASAVIVIDHHPSYTGLPEAGYVDIRTDVGATATILTEYLLAAQVSISTPLATALFYGIQTDTMGLVRDVSPADREAYFFLQTLVDVEALAQIETAQVPAEYFRSLAAALQATRLYNDLAVAYLGNLDYPDLGAEMADLFQRLRGISWVICLGVYGDELIISVRSRSKRVGAGRLVREIVREMGSAGGHGAMAAGHIPLSAELPPDELAQQLIRVALDFLNKGEEEPFAGKPLI